MRQHVQKAERKTGRAAAAHVLVAAHVLAAWRAAWRAALLVLVLIAAEGAAPARAQDAAAEQRAAADSARAPVVQAVRFEGNEVLADRVLERRVRTTANRRFLGIPGFTWWRWVYQLGDAIGGRIGGALKSGGEAPARLDRTLLREDAGRLRELYRQEGFREARVEAEVQPAGDPNEVDVIFRIEPGKPLYVRYVEYEGLERLTGEQQRALTRVSVLEPAHVDEARPLRFQAVAQRYSAARLLEERQRILQFLRNAGYAAVTRDSVRALIFPQPNPTAAPDSFDVTFRIQPGPRYRMGDVHFVVRGPEEGAPPRRDTIDAAPGLVVADIEDEGRLAPRLLDRALQLRPGQWYDAEELQATKRRLENTGVFAFTDITAQSPHVPADPAGAGSAGAGSTNAGSFSADSSSSNSTSADSIRTDSAHVPRLPHRIDLRTRNRHQIGLETFMLQRSDILGGGGTELGTGVAATYENVNLLGGGETFELRLAGSVASSFDDEARTGALFSSAQAEINASLTYPYLLGVFDRLEDRLDLYEARTRLSLSLLTARRENLRFIIRGRGAGRLRLEMRHTATVSSLIDLVDLSLSNPDTLGGFQRFLDQVIGPEDDPVVTDPVQRARIQEDYTEPQINSAVRYTLRAADVNPLRRARGYSYEASVEVGNTIPVLLDRFVLTPDTVESTLPSLPLLRGDSDNRLVYRPYVRFLGDLRRYWPVTAEDVVALKFIAGWAHPTGRPAVVPFDRRFYSGGATSVRGWNLRELRPQPAGGAVPNLLGGDIKLEASAELRSILFRNLLTADWGAALFVDAGNVWYGPRNPGGPAGRFRWDKFYSEMGVGSGIGLRLAWDYLILRLDVAFKVHDPLRPDTGLFPDGLSAPRLHFGIGHAF